MKAQISEIEKPFNKAQQRFEQVIQKLESRPVQSMTHSEVENCIQAEGMEVLRQLFQDHLDLRSLREQKSQAVLGQDGIQRRPNRGQSRQLESIFGTVTVMRLGYGQKGEKSIHPLDVELNLPPEKYSHSLQRVAATEAARGSYDEALVAVERYTGGKLPKRQAEELMQRASCDFESLLSLSLSKRCPNRC